MTSIDINLVHLEHAPNLIQDGRSCSLNAISREDSVNVVGFDAMLVDHVLFIAACKVPQARDVGAIGSELRYVVSTLDSIFPAVKASTYPIDGAAIATFLLILETVRNSRDLTNHRLQTRSFDDTDEE